MAANNKYDLSKSMILKESLWGFILKSQTLINIIFKTLCMNCGKKKKRKERKKNRNPKQVKYALNSLYFYIPVVLGFHFSK